MPTQPKMTSDGHVRVRFTQTPKPPGHSVKIDDDIYQEVADRAAAMEHFQPKPGRLINYMLREHLFPSKTSQQIADAHKAKRKRKAAK